MSSEGLASHSRELSGIVQPGPLRGEPLLSAKCLVVREAWADYTYPPVYMSFGWGSGNQNRWTKQDWRCRAGGSVA